MWWYFKELNKLAWARMFYSDEKYSRVWPPSRIDNLARRARELHGK